MEPWEWPEGEWRGRVNHVRAGKSLKPVSWPGGARCAVALSFDSDHETNELRDGGQSIGRLSLGPVRQPRRHPAHPVDLPQESACLPPSSCQRSPPCCIPTSSGASSPRAMRSASTAGSTSCNSVLPEAARSATCSCARPIMLREDHRHARRSACARRPGISRHRRSPSSREHGPALRFLADGRRRLLRAAARRRSRPASSSCRSNGSATTRSISTWTASPRLRPHTPPPDVLEIFMREFDARS